MKSDETIERAGFLLKRGFDLISSQLAAERFGNSIIVLERGALRVRIVRDRRQDFVDVASTAAHNEKWFDLSLILQAFGHSEGILELTKLEAEAPLLERVLPELETAFSGNNWKATYRELKKLRVQRAKEMFPSLRNHPLFSGEKGPLESE